MSWFVMAPNALSSAPTFSRTTTVLLSICEGLRVDAILRLPFDRGFLQPFGLGFRALARGYGQLPAQQEVAAVAVGNFLHVSGPPDVLDILGQHHLQFRRPSETV